MLYEIKFKIVATVIMKSERHVEGRKYSRQLKNKPVKYTVTLGYLGKVNDFKMMVKTHFYVDYVLF